MIQENLPRRRFIKAGLGGVGAISLAGLLGACGKPQQAAERLEPGTENLFFKLSLAQWSLHRALNDGTVKAEAFPTLARERFDLSAVEYVNGFYLEQATDAAYWNRLNQRAKDSGVKNLLIMVDDEGDLGNPLDNERRSAVENHYKWVDVAHRLECHSIRVNGFGEGTREAVGTALVDGLGVLAEYADQAGISVLIENHGLYSSDGQWVADVITRVGRENCGTLPDFGNFCTAEKWGEYAGRHLSRGLRPLSRRFRHDAVCQRRKR